MRQEKAAKKRRIVRKYKETLVKPRPGHWVHPETADIHGAIIEFLRITTCKLLPNMQRCRVIEKRQPELSDLALSTRIGAIGYQRIIIIGEKVTIEAAYCCKQSFPISKTWQGLLSDPHMFDELAKFVGTIVSDYYRHVEYVDGSKLYR